MLLEDKVTFDNLWTFFGELRNSHKKNTVGLYFTHNLEHKFFKCGQLRAVREKINLSASYLATFLAQNKLPLSIQIVRVE